MSSTNALALVIAAQDASGKARVTTSTEAGVSKVTVNALAQDGLVEFTGDVRKTGKRGRPAHQFRVTRKGRDRARRAAQKA